MTGSEVVTIAEDGTQRDRDRAGRRRAAHEVLVDAEIFERVVQPLRPRRIGVAVRNKGAIFERDGLCHSREPIERVALVAPAARSAAWRHPTARAWRSLHRTRRGRRAAWRRRETAPQAAQ